MSSQLVLQVQHVLSLGFENPEAIIGRCQLNITDASTNHFVVMEVSPKLRVYGGQTSEPDAVITIPLASLELIAAHSEQVDFRDPSVIGTIQLQGDRVLASYFGKLMLKPSQDTMNRLDPLLERKCEAYAIQSIERVESITELELLQTLADCKPIVITNPKVPTPYHQWSLEKLVEKYGDVPLIVRSIDEQETMGEFITRMQQAQPTHGKITEGHTKAYTEGCTLPDVMGEEFVPPYFSLHDYIEPQIWLGNVPTHIAASSLHRDPLDGFLYQVMGRKKLLMYAPDQAPYLYPMKAYNNYQPCWVKPETPDLKRYPDFAKARPIEVVLAPGEMLIQPAGWFHVVYCLDTPTFSVSHFYRH